MIVHHLTLQRAEDNHEFGRRFTIYFDNIDSFTAGLQYVTDIGRKGGADGKKSWNSPLDTQTQMKTTKKNS